MAEEKQTGTEADGTETAARIIIACAIILSLALPCAAIQVLAYTEYIQTVNMSSLPASIEKEVELACIENTTLDLTYGEYLSGPNGIYFAGVAKKKVNITAELPEISKGDYISWLNTSHGESFRFVWDIEDDPTADDFGLTLDKSECTENESVYITVYAPQNTSLMLYINGSGGNSSYSTLVSVSTMLIYTPNQAGNYTIKADMRHRLYNLTIDKLLSVKKRFSCSIRSATEALENTTTIFSAEINGGSFPYYYKWDFGDSATSTLEAPAHSFGNTGDYMVQLTVRDRYNSVAECAQGIMVSPITYSIDISVVDNATGKPVGDTLIKIDGTEKKSNVNGRVIFKEVEKKRQRITAKREGYLSYSDMVLVNESKKITISLEQVKPDMGNLPEVELRAPEEGCVINNEKLSAVFEVSSPTQISECRLLVNEIPFLGYRVAGSIYNLTSGENRIEAEISNGTYNVKVSCENMFGSGASEKVTITGKNFPGKREEIRVAPKILESENKNEGEVDGRGGIDRSIGDDKNNGENNLAHPVTERHDLALGRIKSLEGSIISYTAKEKKIISALGLDKKITEGKVAIEKLRVEAVSLEGLKIPMSDYNSQKNQISGALTEIEGKIPAKITFAEPRSYQETAANEQEIKDVLGEYLKYRGKNISRSVRNYYEKKSAEEQGIITVSAEITYLSIEYLSGKKEEYSLIKKEIKKSKDNKGIMFIEVIPKEVAKDVGEIHFLFDYEVIKEDPIIRIEPDENCRAGTEEILYYVKSKVAPGDVESSRTIVLIDPAHPSNKMTGLAVLSSPSAFFESTAPIVVLSMAVGIIAIVGSYSAIKKRKQYAKNIGGGLGKKKGNNSIGTFILSGIGAIKGKSDETIGKLAGIAQDIANSGAESRKDELYSVLESTISLLNRGMKEAAFSQYSRIVPLYEQQPDEVKKTLAPVMHHLYSEIEIFNFLALVEEAERQVIDGVYDVNGELNGQIESIYTDMPDDLLPRVINKYKRFNGFLNLKNFRKDTELRLNARERAHDELALDNSIWAGRNE